MKEEAPPSGGLDSRGAPRRRWPRRTPYGVRREGVRRDDDQPSAGGHADGTYAALDLGTNNCRLLDRASDRRRISRYRRVLAHHSPGGGGSRFASYQ